MSQKTTAPKSQNLRLELYLGQSTGHQLQGAGLTVEPKRRQWPAHRVIGALALALVLSLAILAVWLFRSRGRAPTGIRSLAVLPLDNLSGDASQDYFADGMTDELITDLAQIRALRVISRTSVMAYKGRAQASPGDRARVERRRCCGRHRAAVRRAGPNHGSVDPGASRQALMGRRAMKVNLRDTLALQNKVARAIAEQIRIK